MSDSKALRILSRRAFVATLSTFSGAAVVACKKKQPDFACTDVSALTDVDRETRTRLAYVDRSPSPDKECFRCIQYVEADEGCGGCKITRGPIHPQGTCRSFAAKM
jgi:hypothetical protein